MSILIPLVAQLISEVAQQQQLDQTDESPQPAGPDLEGFFADYETLYPLIPDEGLTGSHRYLLERSAEKLGISFDTTTLADLQAEITRLREQILELTDQLASSDDPLSDVNHS